MSTAQNAQQGSSISGTDDARVTALLLDRDYLVGQIVKMWSKEYVNWENVADDKRKKQKHWNGFRYARGVHASLNKLAIDILKSPGQSLESSTLYGTILDGTVGASIPEKALKEHFGDDGEDIGIQSSPEEDWSQLHGSFARNLTKSNGQVNPDSLKAWQKYLVLIRICLLFFENLQDSRNIRYEEERDNDTELPDFFQKKKCSKAKSEANLKERNAEISAWTEYLKSL